MRVRLNYFVPALIAAIAAGTCSFGATSRVSTTSVPSTKVQVGFDYYVSATVIELTELDPQGESWDSNNSAPDIYYEIYWKGSRIFQSTTKDDSFIAKWSNAEIDLKQLALNGGTTSLDNLVQAARLNIKADEHIELRVYDSDIVDSQIAGSVMFASKDLLVGDTTYEYIKPGVRRIVLRVSDMSKPVDVAKLA